MAENHRKPVLDLTTLVERPQIAIDGTRYDILSPDEVSIVDLERFAAIGRRAEHLAGLDAATEEDQGEVVKLINDLAARIMIGVPEDVRSALSLANLMRVVEVFIALLPAALTKAAGARNRSTSRSTGAKPSRVSSASTAAALTGGSRKPQSRS
jgi:hypothetical protein